MVKGPDGKFPIRAEDKTMTSGVFVSDRFGIIDNGNAHELANRLPYVGEGATRTAYDLGDVVIKIDNGYNRRCGNSANEANVWETLSYEDRRYFAEVFASGEGWIIMEKVSDLVAYSSSYDYAEYTEACRVARSYGIGDLHDYNVGVRADGSVCIIDYAYEADTPSHITASLCECYEHDCRACYPEGCECCCSAHQGSEGCEPFYGCNETLCSLCLDQYARAEHWPSLFGFVQPHAVQVCEGCNPDHVREVRQIKGQGQFVFRFARYIGATGPAHSLTVRIEREGF